MLYNAINATHPPKGGPVEARGLSASNLVLIFNNRSTRMLDGLSKKAGEINTNICRDIIYVIYSLFKCISILIFIRLPTESELTWSHFTVGSYARIETHVWQTLKMLGLVGIPLLGLAQSARTAEYTNCISAEG